MDTTSEEGAPVRDPWERQSFEEAGEPLAEGADFPFPLETFDSSEGADAPCCAEVSSRAPRRP